MAGTGFEERFEALRGEMLRFLAGRQRAFPQLAAPIDRAGQAIAAARLAAAPPQPRRLPGCRHLPAALEMAAGGPMAPLAAAFAALEGELRWLRSEHYRASLGDGYMANYGYANIIGFDAPAPHERVVASFFVIGPGRHYPRHRHQAEEIYFPFGGDTLWGQGDEAPRPRPPGEAIHNPPWLPHEMIARATPLFTFCFWLSSGPIALAQLLDRDTGAAGLPPPPAMG